MLGTMVIIGITGTNGAGKGTVVQYLVTKGFTHYSARDFILEEVARRGMPPTRDSTTEVGNDLRAKHAPDYIISQLLERALAALGNAVIESVRTPAELALLRTVLRFYLIAVDAEARIRYERVSRRGTTLDNISFDTFIEQENREMHSDNATKQNVGAVIRNADFLIENNGTQDELEASVGKIYRDIFYLTELG
ncbi:MAG: AAA family ATPase [Candidatus Vogelbacteria bacterium]|nr:AAA family ATPase [Candidatus Vogelbacteria bacterium]